MNVLVLGGTVFLGRHVVDALLERGHSVTLFNRGISEPNFQVAAEQIHGNRETDLGRLGDRRWDAVVDTSCFKPPTAEISARYFAERTARYLFVSTISVYDLTAGDVITEDTPIPTEPRDEYGPAKARCEAIVRSTFRHRATVVRPGLIVGPYDPTDRFTYWPVRVAAGGEVLAPVAPSEPTQFIDARDLARFIVDLLERTGSGTYNATSPRGMFTMGDVLQTCAQVTTSGAAFVWAGEEFITKNGVQQWTDLPLWVAQHGGARSVVNADTAAALARGLKIRPLRQTVQDTLEWATSGGKRRGNLVAGLTPQREAELLSALSVSDLA